MEKDLYAEKTGSGTGDDIDFRKFYSFLFPFLKETGQKSLTGELAVAVWGIALAPKYPLAKEFVDYASVSLLFGVSARSMIFEKAETDDLRAHDDCAVQSLGAGFKGVSSDMWTQLLQFCKSVGDDMTGYSEEDACECHPHIALALASIRRRLIEPLSFSMLYDPTGPSTIDSFAAWKRAQK